MSRYSVFRERVLSPVGLHAVGFCVLAIATILLGIRVGLDWRETSSSNLDAMANRQAELRTLQIQTAPLRGLDKKVDEARKQIDSFYNKRIPPSYSMIAEQMGEIAAKGPVRLTRMTYTQAPGSGDLTEIRLDAGLSGEYAGVMRFVNGLERSQTFFIIRAMNLSGQQSGTVNLRLQVSTWLRPGEVPSDVPVEGAPGTAAPKAGSEAPKADGAGTALLRRGGASVDAERGEGL